MRHALPLAVALFFVFAAYAYQAVMVPNTVSACYCTAQSLAVAVQDDQVTVVAGTVGPSQPDRTPVVLDTWFHGPFPSNVLWLMGGTSSSSSCDAFMRAGERRLMVLYGGPRAPGANGMYSSSLCAPNEVIGTPEGDELFAEAVVLFGAQSPPASGSDLPATEPAPWISEGLIWTAAAAGAGMLLLGAIVLLARRRRTG